MDDPALEQGWWAVEMDAGGPCRWTYGDAMLPFLGTGVLDVELSATMRYPVWHIGPPVAARPDRAAAWGDLPNAKSLPKVYDTPPR